MLSTLQPGEKVWRSSMVHEMTLLFPLFWTIFISYMLYQIGTRHGAVTHFLLWRLIFLIPAIYLWQHVAAWLFTEAAVTNQRILCKHGWIAMDIAEIQLKKIESMGIRQGLLGRMFGYGTLVVHGSGGFTVKVPMIKNIMDFRGIVQQAVTAVD